MRPKSVVGGCSGTGSLLCARGWRRWRSEEGVLCIHLVEVRGTLGLWWKEVCVGDVAFVVVWEHRDAWEENGLTVAGEQRMRWVLAMERRRRAGEGDAIVASAELGVTTELHVQVHSEVVDVSVVVKPICWRVCDA